ncbi:MAG TPA: MFS transporter [Pyrinomonadaceae bacterium]|nr:MFS transporter [Pyrinomonadaceae bacterium]
MKRAAEGRASKVFYGWWIVVIAALGLSVGYGPIIVYTFSVFFKPVSEEFNWGRTETSLVFSLSLIVMVLAMPFIGRLIDRFGARKVIVTSALLFGLSLISFFLFSFGTSQFYFVYIAIGLIGAGTTPLSYNRVLSHWFDKRRGLALGLATIGIGISTFIMPLLAHYLVASFGWRAAYMLLGLLVVVVTIPVAGLFLKETPQSMGLMPDGEKKEEGISGKRPGGIGIREALRSSTFWLMCSAFFLVSASINGCLIHLVPMLTDRNVSPATAAIAASFLGGATLIGRVGTGYLLDRFFASYIAIWFFGGASVGILLLWGGAAVFLSVVAAVLLGLGNGAETDVMAYQMSRYFGLRAFSEIYSYILAAYTLGGVVGPLLMGISFDSTGSYRLILMIFIVAILVSVGLLLRLGPYRSWEATAESVV